MILDKKDDNVFKVDLEQVTKLEELVEYYNVDTIGDFFLDDHWAEFVTKKGILFPKSMKISSTMSDQMCRVGTIHRHLKEYCIINKVILMDGHGRIVSELKDQLSSLKHKVSIHVVDIDSLSDRWHKLFFPKTVKCEVRNILDVVNSIDLDKNDTFIYLNFCGIADALSQLSMTVPDFVDKLEKIRHVMVSFSRRGLKDIADKKEGTQFQKFCKCIDKSWELICWRKDFYSYMPNIKKIIKRKKA